MGKLSNPPPPYYSKGAWNQGRSPYWDPSLALPEGDQKDPSNRNGNRYRKRKDFGGNPRKTHYNNNNSNNNSNSNNNNSNNTSGLFFIFFFTLFYSFN